MIKTDAFYCENCSLLIFVKHCHIANEIFDELNEHLSQTILYQLVPFYLA